MENEEIIDSCFDLLGADDDILGDASDNQKTDFKEVIGKPAQVFKRRIGGELDQEKTDAAKSQSKVI